MDNNDTVLQYKCPQCGGGLEFDSESQHMKCPYCDSEFSMEALKGADEPLVEATDEPTPIQNTQDENVWQDGETDGMAVYVCESCGGEIIGDETTAATSCPYCSNPVVFRHQFAGDLRPDVVIPFKLDKKAAKEALKRHVMGKRLLPKVFKDENHIDEIKGVYVPFWIFDTDVDANMTFNANRQRSWSDANWIYTETTYFRVVRDGKVSFANIPVDGSSKMPDDLMEAIEPFDFSQAVDFQTAYLSGYLADKYDVNQESGNARIEGRVKDSTTQTFARTVTGYHSVVPATSRIHFAEKKVKYALYPVWILNTSWNGKKYLFAMNGQTGKFVGDLPVDKKAYRKWLWGLTAAIGAGIYLLLFLLLGL